MVRHIALTEPLRGRLTATIGSIAELFLHLEDLWVAAHAFDWIYDPVAISTVLTFLYGSVSHGERYHCSAHLHGRSVLKLQRRWLLHKH